MCTLVDLGEGLCPFFSFSPLLGGLSLEGEPHLWSHLPWEGLWAPEVLLQLQDALGRLRGWVLRRSPSCCGARAGAPGWSWSHLRPGAAATAGSTAPLLGFMPVVVLLAGLLGGHFISRAILGVLWVIFAFSRRRSKSPSAGPFIIFFES